MTTTTAVPVAIRVAPDRRERVVRLVEGGLGWPVVELDDPDLPPTALVTDVPTMGVATGSADSPPRSVPTLLLVDVGDDPPTAAVAARAATSVLPWPPTPDQLRVAVDGATPERVSRPWCTVVAASGGVGATTVALALAGLRAWRTGPTLAAVTGPAHVADPPELGTGDLASPAVWTAAAAVPGLDGLRVVRLRRDAPGDGLGARHDAVPVTGDVPAVVDLGVVDDAEALPDVLVLRADRAGHHAAATTTARWVVVVGTGDVGDRELVAAVGRHRLVVLRADARVRRACHRGRHPTDAPGVWLRPLDAIVTALEGRA